MQIRILIAILMLLVLSGCTTSEVRQERGSEETLRYDKTQAAAEKNKQAQTPRSASRPKPNFFITLSI
ncbi:MAG: hypothetical protein WDN67_03840 [Candidatus Moraniibacteriota bacterium]